MSGSVVGFPPAAACKQSAGAQRAARPAKAGLEEPIVTLSSRGASAADVAAPEGLAAKRARREMAPQRLEKVQFAPANGMAPAASDPQHLVLGRAAIVAPAIVVPKNQRRLSPNGRTPASLAMTTFFRARAW